MQVDSRFCAQRVRERNKKKVKLNHCTAVEGWVPFVIWIIEPFSEMIWEIFSFQSDEVISSRATMVICFKLHLPYCTEHQEYGSVHWSGNFFSCFIVRCLQYSSTYVIHGQFPLGKIHWRVKRFPIKTFCGGKFVPRSTFYCCTIQKSYDIASPPEVFLSKLNNCTIRIWTIVIISFPSSAAIHSRLIGKVFFPSFSSSINSTRVSHFADKWKLIKREAKKET